MSTPDTSPDTSPGTAPDVGDGSDVQVDAEDLDRYDTPASSDPDAFVEDADLGGVGGGSSGGAG